jgi:hypothetical protein
VMAGSWQWPDPLAPSAEDPGRLSPAVLARARENLRFAVIGERVSERTWERTYAPYLKALERVAGKQSWPDDLSLLTTTLRLSSTTAPSSQALSTGAHQPPTRTTKPCWSSTPHSLLSTSPPRSTDSGRGLSWVSPHDSPASRNGSGIVAAGGFSAAEGGSEIRAFRRTPLAWLALGVAFVPVQLHRSHQGSCDLPPRVLRPRSPGEERRAYSTNALAITARSVE